ncbi:MAG: hypothetical protein ACPGU7_00365 [Gammaproteobacteria bacterium]
MKDLEHVIGLPNPGACDPAEHRRQLQLYINLKLASTGLPTCGSGYDSEFLSAASDLLKSYQEKSRLLSSYLCPADHRIQHFLNDYLHGSDLEGVPRLPSSTIVLDRHGVARELSLPVDGDKFESDIVSSYRLRQGVLHNPASDRRTTKGSFHVAEGGLPIPGDKKAVPKIAFARMLRAALSPPPELMRLPFTAHQEHKAETFVSLLLRPLVCPEIPGERGNAHEAKSMEVRFFAPGNLVSNLDFVESIFGNAGSPYLPENDAGLDVDGWSGHTGCVILAPHLVRLTKRELGLPPKDQATERQIADGMCWDEPNELYNGGQAFKITARDERGVIVTILADNYYGYCKKEVKTQISFAANLLGLAEEEHAGGALAYPRRNHGEEYGADSKTRKDPHTFSDVAAMYGDIMDIQPQGYGIDKRFPKLVYIPREVRFDLTKQRISWRHEGQPQSIKLRPDTIYMQPNGYKVEMTKHPGAPSWRLIGTDPEGVFCHKPCTVSGGGKSEISKSLNDAVIYGPIYTADIDADLDAVEAIFEKDYSDRLKPGHADEDRDPSRKPLSPERSLGSLIKMLTPSSANTDEYNTWLASIPDHIRALVLMIKRIYRPEWGEDWRSHFSVDTVNGHDGHGLKQDGRKLIASYLRVGLEEDGAWRIFKVRQDFIACEKIQMEDDISASVVVPSDILPNASPKSNTASVKLVRNCEYRLFQRPDEAIHRGFDKQTEFDMAQPGNFVANFEPLDDETVTELVEDVVGFQAYTAPMRALLQGQYDAIHSDAPHADYLVSSAHPRLVDGKPSKNPRYLQLRPDLQDPIRKYATNMGTRFYRRVPLEQSVVHPVNAVLTGRRNNPPADGILPLCVFNPIHYQELPELFMDFICSVTGKSPSTTGAGSEGALTKGPFNALRPTADLNNTLVSFILTGYAGFSSAAGHIGPHHRVDHDISLLIPEIWARLDPHERDPAYLIDEGYLERVDDFEHDGRQVLASRLGYRITERFVAAFLGKIFDSPELVLGEDILKPETQGVGVFADGVDNIVEAQRKVAQRYLDDGSIEDACPPLRALLNIMATGTHDGKDVHHPDIRALFEREYLLASDWYRERLRVKQQREVALWERHVHSLSDFLSLDSHAEEARRMGISERLAHAQAQLKSVQSSAYLESLVGTIGADPLSPPGSVTAMGDDEARNAA